MEQETVLISFLAEMYYKQLYVYLQKYVRKKQASDLHKARVCMKKLRSLIRFAVESEVPGKWKKYDKVLGKIFRKAGKVRDLQVCSALLINSGMEAKYISKLFEKKYGESVSNCLLAASDYLPKIKKVMRKLSRKEVFVSVDVLQRHIIKCKDHLHFLLAISSSNDYWHDIRKEIKKILYAKEWSDAENFPLSARTISLYTQMDAAAGEWNNEKVLLVAIRNKKDVENIRNESQLRMYAIEEKLKVLANALSA